MTDTSAVEVSLSAQNTLQEGQELSLSCNINAQSLEKRFFSVAWLWGGTELARIGPTGILTVTQEYSDREKDGELRAMRTGNGNYELRIKPVRSTDGGSFSCRAWLEERGEDGDFNQGAAQDSQPLEVTISTPGWRKCTPTILNKVLHKLFTLHKQCLTKVFIPQHIFYLFIFLALQQVTSMYCIGIVAGSRNYLSIHGLKQCFTN